MTPPRKRRTNTHLPSRMYLKHGSYYYVVPPRMVGVYGKTWLNLGKDYSTALRKYADIHQGHGFTLGALWLKYQTDGMRGNSEATKADKAKAWEALAPTFADKVPDAVTQQDIAFYLDHRSAQTRANREIALLSHMYTKAIRWGLATRNPCIGVERNKCRAGSIEITDEHLRAWLAHCRPIVRLFSLLVYLTGRRPSDVLRTAREQARDDGIHYVEQKTGKAVVIPWTPAMRQAYRELRQTDSGALRFSPWVFPVSRRTRGSDGCYTYSGMSSLWQQDMKTFAGKRFPPRALRAKYATDLERRGGDATQALQHSSRAITQRHYINGEIVAPGLDWSEE